MKFSSPTILGLASSLTMIISEYSVAAAVVNRGCAAGNRDERAVFTKPDDSKAAYDPNINLPRDDSLFCRTRSSDDLVSFACETLVVDTNPWVSGGFRLGCMKKDFTTGWQCAASCGGDKHLPELTDVSAKKGINTRTAFSFSSFQTRRSHVSVSFTIPHTTHSGPSSLSR